MPAVSAAHLLCLLSTVLCVLCPLCLQPTVLCMLFLLCRVSGPAAPILEVVVAEEDHTMAAFKKAAALLAGGQRFP